MFLADLFSSLRNVLANLREGHEPTAVRTESSSPPSQAYLERMRAVELTENHVASLDAVPPSLRPELSRCIAQVQQPLLSSAALAEQVAASRQALEFAIHRGGLAPSAEQTQQLARLAELQRILERWRPPGPMGSQVGEVAGVGCTNDTPRPSNTPRP